MDLSTKRNRSLKLGRSLFTPGSWGALLSLGLALGCAKKQEPPPEGPRPVTVLELREMNPVRPLQLTGSVRSWQDQDVAFELSGRVDWIVEEGTYLEGRWEVDGKVRVEGDVLARMYRRPYEIARDSAKASLGVAQQNHAAAVVQVEKLLPANLEAASAEKQRAQAEWTRYKEARDKNAVAEVDLIRATADRDAMNARYEQAAAAIDTQKAEIEALAAAVREAEQKLEQAQYDLDRCSLYAPFPAEVSEVYVQAGGYAQAGSPVAHIVMMDPILIDLSVSSATARRLEKGDAVRLFAPHSEATFSGSVYEKSTVADPDTRTFRVSVLARNQKTVSGRDQDDPLVRQHPRITRFMHLSRFESGNPESPFVVEENRALRKDAEGWYVWADPARKRDRPIEDDRFLVTLRRFRVTPGEMRWNLQGIYLVRSLEEIGDLEPDSLIAMDVPEGVKDGDQVLVAVPGWRLWPGQLVSVTLGGALPELGLYVPMDTITRLDKNATSGTIFVVSEDQAREVRVRIGPNVGDLFRIEPAESGGSTLVKPGAKVIRDYIHFLQDGESVRVIADRGW